MHLITNGKCDTGIVWHIMSKNYIIICGHQRGRLRWQQGFGKSGGFYNGENKFLGCSSDMAASVCSVEFLGRK